MSNRKQSLNDSEIIIRETKEGLPVGGAPPLSGFTYDASSVIDVLPEDDPVVETKEQLAAPRNLNIESQTVNFAADGTQYVTIVVSFDEVEGADNYEYRISKL